MGFPKSAIWEMMSSAFLVGRSLGDVNSVAVARQWIQRRLQPLVTSQKINRGLNSFFAGCGVGDDCGSSTGWTNWVLPLPWVMIIFLSPFWEPITARCLYLQDRILTTQAAVSGITWACDVRHSEGNGRTTTRHGVQRAP